MELSMELSVTSNDVDLGSSEYELLSRRCRKLERVLSRHNPSSTHLRVFVRRIARTWFLEATGALSLHGRVLVARAKGETPLAVLSEMTEELLRQAHDHIAQEKRGLKSGRGLHQAAVV